MTFADHYRRFGWGVLAVLSSALLVWFGTGLHPFWPLMWLAPLPLLLFARDSTLGGAALTAGLGWLLGSLNLWSLFHRTLEIPAPVVASILATLALVLALAVLLYRALLRRGAPWSALVAFPALWVSFEYLQNLTSPHATSGNLAYTQLELLPFLQLAALTGPWGMSFVLLLFSSALATGLHLRATAPQQARRIVGASLAVLVAVLLFGAVRLSSSSPRALVKVGLVASDPPTSPQVAAAGAPSAKLFAAYAEQAAKLPPAGAQVVVLPEKLGVVGVAELPDIDRLFQPLADRSHSTIVVGLIQVAPPFKFNRARIYAPAVPPVTYDKEHLLPPFESMLKPGTSLTRLTEPGGSWGVAICKDMDFTPLSRDYGRAGVGLLLVPGWDFGVDRWFHGHMAVMRGVESGFSVVRAAKLGDLTVSDNRGRILAETTSDAAPFATLLAAVPAGHDPTLYLLWGDWFAWVALALLGFTTGMCFVLYLNRSAAA